jgi:hypothetical protein
VSRGTRLACAAFCLAAAACLGAGFAFESASAWGQVENRVCGKVDGIPVHSHRVSCKAALRADKADKRRGELSGWSCSASLARCYRGGSSSGRFMRWKRMTYRPLVEDPKARTLVACLEEGRFHYFARPKKCDFFSRVDRNGRRVRDIRTRGLRWTKWGGPEAEAHGWDSTGGRLTVVAYHRVGCGGPLAYYRLVKIRRPSGRTYRMTLAKCGQPRFRPVVNTLAIGSH